MVKKEKNLLLQDLCARLPYGVKVQTGLRRNYETGETFSGIKTMKPIMISIMFENGIEEYKPYLFPLSSMTPKQKAELSMLVVNVTDIFKTFLIEIEFYHKHHIDYRGLIPMGLAIDCTNLNIY